MATETSPSFNYRNVRYRLLPGFARKARQLFSLAGTCRLVWNCFLARNQEAYQLHQENPEHQAKPSVRFFSLCKGFTELHNSGEFPLAEGVFLCCCQSPALRPEAGTTLGSPSLTGGVDQGRPPQVIWPGIGLVGLRRHGGNPYPEGQPVKVDVVFEAGKWYAIVCYRVDRPPGPEPDMVAAMNRNCGQVGGLQRWQSEIHRHLSPRCLTAATGPGCESGSCTAESETSATPGGTGLPEPSPAQLVSWCWRNSILRE
ncbi:hypothetical protein BO91_00685 [Candidatus Synechococcus spongiarum LMB bulk10E]|nr:hypothetical protein BO91_00685 [Candidatus Synechococcus spongiarum LMB bulk10E]